MLPESIDRLWRDVWNAVGGTMRLSRRASEAAGDSFARLERDVRRKAAEHAAAQGREFADLADVHWAYREVILATASDFKQPPRVDITNESKESNA